MEHWEYLKPGGLRFVWEDALFRPGTDSFLLSSLPRLSAGLRVCDLGCGTGLLGLLLLQRQPDLRVTGIDIQAPAISLAEQAAAENRLVDRLTFRCADLRHVRQYFPTGSFDLAVSNPPYYVPVSGKVSQDAARCTARSESEATLADICAAAAYLLRWGGKFCLVHKPERLTDLLCTLRAHRLEPKRIRLVRHHAGADANLVLIAARRGGKPGVMLEPELLLFTPDGQETTDYRRIYHHQED